MRYIGWVVAGCAALGLAVAAWQRGDLARSADGGFAWKQLLWHGFGLVLALVAFSCLAYLVVAALRSLAAGRGQAAPPAKRMPCILNADLDETFDPDIALARYLEAAQRPSYERPPRPRASAWGRRI